MTWLLVIAVSMIVIGCAFSILRDPQIVDYCRTIVEDGRKDTYARNVMALYTSGLCMACAGLCMLVVATIIMVLQ
jgi:hypothetical protein